MWAAADDLQSPYFIAVLVSKMKSFPDLVCIMSDVLNIAVSSTEKSFISKLDDIRLDDVLIKWDKIQAKFFAYPTSNIYFCIYGLFRTSFLKTIKLNLYQNKSLISSEDCLS